MASNTTQLVGDQDFKFTINDEENPLTLNEEDDFDKGKKSLQGLDELESDLRKNKHCTDADVLNALSVFSERASPVNALEREFTRKTFIALFPFFVIYIYCFNRHYV